MDRCEFCPIRTLRAMKQNAQDASKVCFSGCIKCSGRMSHVSRMCQESLSMLTTEPIQTTAIPRAIIVSVCSVERRMEVWYTANNEAVASAFM